MGKWCRKLFSEFYSYSLVVVRWELCHSYRKWTHSCLVKEECRGGLNSWSWVAWDMNSVSLGCCKKTDSTAWWCRRGLRVKRICDALRWGIKIHYFDLCYPNVAHVYETLLTLDIWGNVLSNIRLSKYLSLHCFIPEGDLSHFHQLDIRN